MAAFLAKELKPRACPLARLLRTCGQLVIEVTLPACLSLGVAGRDTSWFALLAHLQTAATAPETSQQFRDDVTLLSQAWAAIRRRFRRRGVRAPRQLVLDPRVNPVVWLVPERLRKDPTWLELLRRVLQETDARRLFARINRAEGVPDVEVHQALLHDTIQGLKGTGAPADLFGDPRWLQVRSSAPISKAFLVVLGPSGSTLW